MNILVRNHNGSETGHLLRNNPLKILAQKLVNIQICSNKEKAKGTNMEEVPTWTIWTWPHLILIMWAYVISIFLDGYITSMVKELTKMTLSSKTSLWTSVWQGQTLFILLYQLLQKQPRRFWTWEHLTVVYTLAYSARFIFSVMSHTNDEQLTDPTVIWFLLLNAAVICAVSWEFWPHTKDAARWQQKPTQERAKWPLLYFE